MRRALSGLAFLIPVLLVLGAFQYWATTAREREWWWFHGGPDHMAFANLRNADEREGHILIAERVSSDAPAIEFDVKWNCDPLEFSWDEAWTRSEDFDQLERVPANNEDREFHAPRNPMERRFLELACDPDHRLEQAFKLKDNRSPIELTREAFAMVAEGVPPPEALQRASED